MGAIIRPIKAVLAWVQRVFAALRRRSALVDHLARMISRYGADQGSGMAAVITLPAFLSLFPLIALALSVAGFVSTYDHGAQQSITHAISGFFPGLVGPGKPIDVSTITGQRTATGIVGIAGLVLGGLGWIGALRQSLRQAWHQPKLQANFFLVKLQDLLVLAITGGAALASLVLTAASTAGAGIVVAHTPIPDGGITKITLQVLGIVIAVGGDMLIFLVLFLRLPASNGDTKAVLSASLFGGIGLEIFKNVGVLYVAHISNNPLYATIGLTIALLVFVNLIARLFIYASIWAVTGPYDSDLFPSGTSEGTTQPDDIGARPTGAVPGSEFEPMSNPPQGGDPPLSPGSGPRRAQAPVPAGGAPMARPTPPVPAGLQAARIAGGATLGALGATGAVLLRQGWRAVREVTRS